jgi:hypothetical protein
LKNSLLKKGNSDEKKALKRLPYGNSNFEKLRTEKSAKKAQSAARALRAKRKEARAQLEKYRNSPMFAGRTDIRYLSLIFIGKDKYEIEDA